MKSNPIFRQSECVFFVQPSFLYLLMDADESNDDGESLESYDEIEGVDPLFSI
jgi:hypothetical protein